MFNVLPYLINSDGEVDFSGGGLKEKRIFLFKDMAEDIEYILEKLGDFLINSEMIVVLFDDKKIFRSVFRSKDEIFLFLMNDVFTCRFYISCFENGIFGCNIPSDQYSSFFIDKDVVGSCVNKEVNERFYSLVKDGSIGFPDASVPYFNSILYHMGMSIT